MAKRMGLALSAATRSTTPVFETAFACPLQRVLRQSYQNFKQLTVVRA